MKKKIIGILVCMLLIAAAVLPVTGTINNNENIKTVNNNENIIEDQTSDESEPQQHYVVSGDEWPMYLHDPQNTGYSTVSIAPQTNTVKWTYTAGNHVYSSPAVVDGKVYIGVEDDSSGGGFHCLDADTGALLWTHFIAGSTSVGSPSVYEDKVYIGGVYDHIYCLDADTGTSIWEVYTEYGIKLAIKPYAGKVYVGMNGHSGVNEGVLYCLDAETGDEIWVRDDLGYTEVSGPAVYDGKVYIVSGSDLYCFDADTGDKLWDYGSAIRFTCSPTIFDGRVYCGAGRLNCLDADTGEELWHFDNSAWTSPAVAYGNVYFSGDAGLFCLDAYTGEEIWNYPEGVSDRYSLSGPAVVDLKVYLGIKSTGKLICVDTETGEKLWDYQTATPGTNWNSPAIAYGRVYMGGGTSCKVYCFEDPSKPPQDPTINGPTGGKPGEEYDFTFLTTDPEGDDVYYYIDWGDDTNSGWIGPKKSGQAIKVSHTWGELGNYVIRVRAKDTYGIKSHWSELDVGISNAPSVPIIDGPTSVKKGTKYDYTFNSVDPDGDDVYYTVVWEQSGGGWVGPYPSGETITLNHTWSKMGKFTIKAKARDSYGVESDEWGYLEVTVPRSKVISNNQLLLKMLQQFPNVFPTLQHLLGL